MIRMLPAPALALVLLVARQPAVPPGLVMVPVIVETAGGRAAPALTAEDFEIVDDGTPRPIEFFSPQPAPLALVVLVDVSRSVIETIRHARGPSASTDLKAPLATLLSQLKEGDRPRLGRIGAKVTIGPVVAANAKARTRAIEAVLTAPDQERGGPSPVWDAIDAAVTSLGAEPGRRIVVVITDGMATGNRLSLADVANRAANANVSVSAIGFEAPVTIRQDRTKVINVIPEVLLQALAEYTGGLYRTPAPATPPDTGADPFETLLASLGHSYTLGFRGGTDGKPHPIEIRVKRPDLKVSARQSYVANGRGQAPPLR